MKAQNREYNEKDFHLIREFLRIDFGARDMLTIDAVPPGILVTVVNLCAYISRYQLL